jgi:hypothetical protein
MAAARVGMCRSFRDMLIQVDANSKITAPRQDSKQTVVDLDEFFQRNLKLKWNSSSHHEQADQFYWVSRSDAYLLGSSASHHKIDETTNQMHIH